jgi:uncharacterized protein involved in outer membrane biogenesis
MAAGSDAQKTGQARKLKVFFGVFAFIGVVFSLLYLAGILFLGSPYASERLSALLTEYMHQRVTVTGLGLSGTNLSVRNIAIANPAGFQTGALVRVRSLVITPNWPEILAGKKNFSLLQVEGLQISLSKNAGGDWNYQQLVHYLALKKKQPAAEFFIKRLIFRDASLQINNFAWNNLSLAVNDFSTKGSTESKLVISGMDTKGNSFQIAGDARLGTNPEVYLTISAPDLSLDTFRDATRRSSVLDLEKGVAHVSVSARYRSGELAAEGMVGFEKLGIQLKEGRIPIAGSLAFAARYNEARDEARLERCSLLLNKVISLKAAATVRQLKGEKKFQATLSCDEIRGKDLLPFIPQKILHNFYVDGRIT